MAVIHIPERPPKYVRVTIDIVRDGITESTSRMELIERDVFDTTGYVLASAIVAAISPDEDGYQAEFWQCFLSGFEAVPHLNGGWVSKLARHIAQWFDSDDDLDLPGWMDSRIAEPDPEPEEEE
ncbi:hypothetical protein NA78x_001785 [Anatilimnocola sp. NA78]|uniref:hypothetical protein n=1 Tax=Anatilimnocola sp. NA78 TaxID=3415683 RepID=UPI003CE53A56